MKPELTDEIVRACFQLGKKHFPKPWPTIYDRADQTSDFMLGLVHGSKRRWWKAEDPVKFLVKYGVWAIRRRRYRLLSQKFNILCMCGKKLKISQKPCHGTMADRVIGPKVLFWATVKTMNEEQGNLGRGRRWTPALMGDPEGKFDPFLVTTPDGV